MGNVQTRQYDAKSMAHRRGSINWNFRYPTLRTSRRDYPTMTIFNSKLSIVDWLDLLDFQRYETNFQMYNRVEDLLEMDDSDLKKLGIQNPAHRAKMLSSLVDVQAKRRQSMNIEVSTLPRAMQKRKNSCPSIYLPEVEDFSKTRTASPAMNPKPNTARHSLNSLKGSADKRRLTWSATNSIYEIKSDESNESLHSSDNDSSDQRKNSLKMENGSSRVGSTANLSTASPTSSYLATSPGSNSVSNALPPTMVSTTPSNEHQEAIALKKALEWELSLDSRDLRSHAWYHGPLPRQRAEEIVQREGDFLVRDCASQPDNYVLTCRSKSAVLHFVINKIVLQPETVYERIQYQFEEDAFDAVPDLITFYVGSGKAISAASGARIQFPCNRIYPLSFYGHKIVGNQLHTQMQAGIRGASPLNSPISNNGSFRFNVNSAHILQQQQQQQQQQQNQQQVSHSPLSSPPRTKRDIPPRLPSKKQRSQSLTPVQAMVVSNMKNAEAFNSADGIIQSSSFSSSDTINEEIGEDSECVTANGNATATQRRFSNFEKSSEMQSLNGNQQPNPAQNKLNTNGFQTIARCSATSELMDRVKFTTHSLPRSAAVTSFRGNFTRTSSLARDFTAVENVAEEQIPEESSEKPPSPPPKPIRAPGLPSKSKELAALAEQQQQALQRAAMAAAAAAAAAYHASGSDSGNGSGDSVHSSIPGDSSEFTLHRGVIIKNPRFMSNSASSATLKSLSEFDAVAAEELLFTLDIPEFKVTSKFDVENYSTLLLPSVDNKPLDGDALSTFKMMLLETGPKMIAEHITRIDIGLLIDEASQESDIAIRDVSDASDNANDSTSFLHSVQLELDCCGLEMLTLPQGKAFRNDLIERTQCIKLMVAVTILTCQTDLDRAELLSKWIQIAVETKTALGNLFGFCAIMLGLCMSQIQRLDQAWHILRQKFTDSAFTFEAKLRPTLISMNECSNPQAPNTTVPHVLLYALLKDRPVLDIININTNTMERSSLYVTCITSWESKADDFGMGINFLHLDSARGFLKNLTLYRKNAKIVLEESQSRLDELLSDAFRTEFHIKFLWGSKGALATAEDRHGKLEKVLTLMADKFCSADNNTIAA